DGKTVVTASADNTARLWDATTGKQTAILLGHSGPVLSAGFSSDGKTIVTASHDNTARLWSVATAKQIAWFSGHAGPVNSSAFSPDSARIVSASDDHTARLWDISWISETRGAALRNRVCEEKLIGAQEFTESELDDPILRRIDKG